MKLNIHVDMLAIQDSYSWLKVGDCHRLPLEVYGDFVPSDNQKTYLRHIDNYMYSVNAKLLKVVKKSMGAGEDYTDDYGLAYFEVELEGWRSLYFFMQFDNNNVELSTSMAHLKEGEHYIAEISFFLECGAMSSIVHGLWDEIAVGDVCRRQPYTFVLIDEIYTTPGDELSSLYYDVDFMEASGFVLSCTWMGSDEFGGKILDYYSFCENGRLRFQNLGSFRFALIDIVFDKAPVYLLYADGKYTRLYTGAIDYSMDDALTKLEKDIYLHDLGGEYQLSADFEDISIKFYDGSLIKLADWEDSDECEAKILVQLTSTYTSLSLSPSLSNILTKTSLSGLREFVQWDKENIENHMKHLEAAEKNGYRYDDSLYEIKI
ncbi:MAG TPA: hypothetical protein EYG70_07985 [Sulfurimonas sp.]|nr:hypothetical protein [Sulfurimonas sp.]